jgi:hypothetical protein
VEDSDSLRDIWGADACGCAIARGVKVAAAVAANRAAANRKFDRLLARFIVAPENVVRIAP